MHLRNTGGSYLGNRSTARCRCSWLMLRRAAGIWWCSCAEAGCNTFTRRTGRSTRCISCCCSHVARMGGPLG
eukprot:99240-Prymnesium_polylepis.1